MTPLLGIQWPVHSFPNSSEKQLAQSAAVLSLIIILGEPDQLLLDVSWSTATLLQVIVNVAIAIGPC